MASPGWEVWKTRSGLALGGSDATKSLREDGTWDSTGGSGGGLPWWPTLVDPTLPAWAWDNQGGATVVEANGIVFLSVPSASTSLRSRLIAAPATPWTATILMKHEYTTTAATQYAGLVLGDGTGKRYVYYNASNDNLQAVKFTNATTFSAVGAVNDGAIFLNKSNLHWLRIADNGTNLIFSGSSDGRNFTEYGSEDRTVFLEAGPTLIGIFGNADSAVRAFSTSFFHWDVT